MAKGREHWHAPVGDRRTIDRLSDAQRTYNRLQAGLRALVEQSIAHLANAWALRRWRGCCTGSGASSGPPARWSAWAAGCTGSPHESIMETPLTFPRPKNGTVITEYGGRSPRTRRLPGGRTRRGP